MGIHSATTRDELPSSVCKFCGKQDSYYEGLDSENEIADVEVLCCFFGHDCPVANIDWSKFLGQMIPHEY